MHISFVCIKPRGALWYTNEWHYKTAVRLLLRNGIFVLLKLSLCCIMQNRAGTGIWGSKFNSFGVTELGEDGKTKADNLPLSNGREAL